MSACSAQAISHVGCRLMVASSANTSRPLRARRMRRHRARLGDEGGNVFRGGRLRLRQRTGLAGRRLRRRGYFGCRFRFGRFAGHKRSPIAASLMWAVIAGAVNAQERLACDREVDDGQFEVAGRLGQSGDRRVGRNRPGIGHQRRRLGVDRLQRAVVVEEFVEHVLDRCLGLVRTGIAHVVVLEAGTHDRDAGLLADFVSRERRRDRS